MKTVGNILWFVLIGFLSSVSWFLIGVVLCITIIGIPFGKQCFKIAGLTIWPFGKNIDTKFDAHPIANILWLIFFGWELAVGYLTVGLIFFITIIGIPFGKQCFKLAQLSFFPFGATIN
ncbi:MAG TPA: YccF domain-containing protein [Bacilli bacterium]|nr:YccF domain-containing protein [Bacilli bacterium]